MFTKTIDDCRILKLISEGVKPALIAKEIGCHRSTVYRVIEKASKVKSKHTGLKSFSEFLEECKIEKQSDIDLAFETAKSNFKLFEINQLAKNNFKISAITKQNTEIEFKITTAELLHPDFVENIKQISNQ